MTVMLVGSLALGVPAASAKRVTVAKKTVTLAGPGRSGSALAVCPKGTQAAAGGYSQSPPANLLTGAASLIDVSDSFRQSSRSWTVTGTQVNGGSGALTAYAYCLRNMPRIRPVVVIRPLDAAARSQATVTAPCPGKSKVVSGGYRKPPFSGGSFVFLLDNERAGRTSWKVTAVRGSVGSTAVGKVYSVAYCAAGAKISSAIASANLPVTAAPSSPTPVTAPKCKRALTFAGGFRSPFVTGGADRGAFLATDAFLRHKKWRVSGLTFGGPGAVGLSAKVSVIGYCR